MATRTYQHSKFNDGQVIVEFDINDANWRMSQVRCINNSQYPALITVLERGVVVFTTTASSNRTSSWNTTGIQLGWSTEFENEGLIMGNYIIHVRYPS